LFNNYLLIRLSYSKNVATYGRITKLLVLNRIILFFLMILTYHILSMEKQ